MKTGKLLILLLFIALQKSAFAQVDSKKIHQIIQPLLSDYPGIQIAIGTNNKLVFKESYGFSDLAKKTLTQNNDLFRIYSISKFITTIALLQQVEIGAIDPDKPVIKYIPSWDESKINPWSTKITPRHLAMHRSGIRHYEGLNEVYSTQQCHKVDESISLFDQSYLLFEPGTEKSYSSWGFVLLSKLIEEVSHTTYKDYISKKIFEPIQMSKIMLYDREKVIPEAHIYERDSEGNYMDVTFANPSCKFGAGGFISTAEDLVKLGMSFYSGSLISNEMIQIAVSGDVTDNVFMVGGVSAGARSILAIDMKTGKTIAILGNQRGIPFESIIKEILPLIK